MSETTDLPIKGLTFARVRRVTADGDALLFEAEAGQPGWVMHHRRDCCEVVSIEDITGDLSDLEGVPLVEAYVSTESGNTEYDGTCTWTFYHLRTVKGDVSIRWYGESNGYYSEGVDLETADQWDWKFYKETP